MSEFVETRTKVHRLMRATRTYQKGGISPKIQMRRFWEIKDFGLERLATCAIVLQEVGIC